MAQPQLLAEFLQRDDVQAGGGSFLLRHSTDAPRGELPRATDTYEEHAQERQHRADDPIDVQARGDALGDDLARSGEGEGAER